MSAGGAQDVSSLLFQITSKVVLWEAVIPHVWHTETLLFLCVYSLTLLLLWPLFVSFVPFTGFPGP